jgi:hypothetical protein
MLRRPKHSKIEVVAPKEEEEEEEEEEVSFHQYYVFPHSFVTLHDRSRRQRR